MTMRTIVTLYILCVLGCVAEQDPKPRPRLYPRVEFPEKSYLSYKGDNCPFVFEIPVYAQIAYKESFLDGQDHPCWFDLVVYSLGSTVFCSYFALTGEAQLDELINDAHVMVSKHNVKASFREDIPVQNAQGYKGKIFKIEGPVATPYQFYITDEKSHFLRGSLYFEDKINQDSLRPYIHFVQEDIQHLLASIRWQ